MSNQFNSKLVMECHSKLAELGENNILCLMWIPGHQGIAGNEKADQLAKASSEKLLIEPESTCRIAYRTAREQTRSWLRRKHYLLEETPWYETLQVFHGWAFQ